MKKYLIMAAMMLLVAATSTSCKKEVITSQIETATSSTFAGEDSDYAPLNGDSKTTHSMTPTEVIDSYVPLNLGDSILDYTRGIVKPTNLTNLSVRPLQRIPRVLAELSRRPQFTELWDVNHYVKIDADPVMDILNLIDPDPLDGLEINPTAADVYILEAKTPMLHGWNYLTVMADRPSGELRCVYCTSYYGYDHAQTMEEVSSMIDDAMNSDQFMYLDILSYDYTERFFGGYVNFATGEYTQLYRQGRDGETYSSGHGYMTEHGFVTTGFCDFGSLRHRRDLSSCERWWTGVEHFMLTTIGAAALFTAPETLGVSVGCGIVLGILTSHVCSMGRQRC